MPTWVLTGPLFLLDIHPPQSLQVSLLTMDSYGLWLYLASWSSYLRCRESRRCLRDYFLIESSELRPARCRSIKAQQPCLGGKANPWVEAGTSPQTSLLVAFFLLTVLFPSFSDSHVLGASSFLIKLLQTTTCLWVSLENMTQGSYHLQISSIENNVNLKNILNHIRTIF